MRTDFFVCSFARPKGERLVILRPAEIPASFFVASSFEDKLREALFALDYRHCFENKRDGPPQVAQCLRASACRAQGLNGWVRGTDTPRPAPEKDLDAYVVSNALA